MKRKKLNKLGVDIGGVIITPSHGKNDTSFFSSDYLKTPAVAGAFETLAWLNAAAFPNSVYLVSKAKQKTADKTMKWLAHHGFHEETGISKQRVFFVEKREEKAPIASQLRLDAFIDDRPDVLSYLGSMSLRILFAHKAEAAKTGSFPDFHTAIGWRQVRRVINSYED